MSVNLKAALGEFESKFDRKADFISVAPGRVNIIGEHTDYNGGCVLPAAIDREVVIVCALRDDKKVDAYSVNLESRVEFELDAGMRFSSQLVEAFELWIHRRCGRWRAWSPQRSSATRWGHARSKRARMPRLQVAIRRSDPSPECRHGDRTEWTPDS